MKMVLLITFILIIGAYNMIIQVAKHKKDNDDRGKY